MDHAGAPLLEPDVQRRELALRCETSGGPYIEGARTGPELRRDINLLIGELNSSHSGISKPAQPSVRTGRLGLRF